MKNVVDGYTAGITVIPADQTCPAITCDIPPYSQDCPPQNMINLSTTVVGCLSDCSLFDDDYYCCRGDYNSPDTCLASSGWFKKACPETYSFAFDDVSGTKSCATSNLSIIFSCSM
jgi:hypothetical protein